MTLEHYARSCFITILIKEITMNIDKIAPILALAVAVSTATFVDMEYWALNSCWHWVGTRNNEPGFRSCFTSHDHSGSSSVSHYRE